MKGEKREMSHHIKNTRRLSVCVEVKTEQETSVSQKTLTQLMVCRLQGSATFPQDVHLKNRLRPGFYSEGGDGMLVDALRHAVMETLNQLLYISTELAHALSILGLKRRQTGHFRGKRNATRLHASPTVFSASARTLIRNLRDRSTRVTSERPALWQMETAFVDQAVEKFNLKTQHHRQQFYKDFVGGTPKLFR